MKFRRRQSPFLLLLLPAVASAVAVPDASDATISANLQPRDAKAQPETTPLIDVTAKSKYEIGTKDAPVDGKDGMPHAGPWVGTEKDKDSKKKAEADDDSLLKGSKEDLAEKLKSSTGTKIPEKNDGVMDDEHRQIPKEGTRGTEGGVSQKNKDRKEKEGQTGEKIEQKPASPKEAPAHPNGDATVKTEKPKLKDAQVTEEDVSEGLAGLEKPDDLPKSKSDAHPIPASANKDHLNIKDDTKQSAPLETLPENDGLIQPLHSFLLSLTMILFSEIGDKTFLVAALMAMKHDRILVFSAAFSALFVMTILSAVLGHTVPSLIPKKFTNFLAAGLFLVFGGRLMREGLAMSPDEGVDSEMQEVEQELEEKEHLARKAGRRRSSISPYILESGLGTRNHTRKSRSGSRLPSPPRSPSSSPDRSPSPKRSTISGALGGLNNLLSLLLSPAWVQTFVMTFLGEWGDRSQIATIAMAAGQDYWWVTGGAVSGHAVCTGVAVIGGRAIAGKVSLRVVTLGGAIAFLVFGVIYLLEAFWYA